MEPISVDAPLKVPTIPGPKPVSPKVEPPKVEAAKSEPPAELPISAGSLLTRKRAALAASAVFSLVAGVAGVQVFGTSTPETKTSPAAQALVATPHNSHPAPTDPTPPTTPRATASGLGVTAPSVTQDTLPPAELVVRAPQLSTEVRSELTVPVVTPSAPAYIPPLGPGDTIPLPSPTISNDGQFRAATPPARPELEIPAVAPANVIAPPTIVPPLIVPASAQEPLQPAALPGTLPLPPTPAGGTGMPVLPTLPSAPTAPVIPSAVNPAVAPSVVPAMPLPNTPAVPPVDVTPPISVFPPDKSPAAPVIPPAMPPGAPAANVLPLGPAMTPDVVPPMLTPSVVPPVVTPIVPPVLTPPTPSVVTPIVPPGQTNNGNRSIEYVKPAATPEVNLKPAATSFDVDLYDPRVGDSYDSISKEFYNDSRYASALREFNRNKPLQGSGPVEVPPMHILRKRFPQSSGGSIPSPALSSVRPVTGTAPDNWTSPGTSEASPTFRTSSNTYRVPAGGTTMKLIAKEVLGSDSRWGEIWELNREITDPGALLIPGTELKLPAAASSNR